MSDDESPAIQPLAPFIKIGANLEPYLEGIKCAACGEVLAAENRRACPKCATVGSLHPIRLAELGQLYSYTVVHRSFPGIKTPFISALVDLEGGGTIRGNLIDVAADEVFFEMPVRVAFEILDVTGDRAVPHVRHVFVPLAK